MKRRQLHVGRDPVYRVTLQQRTAMLERATIVERRWRKPKITWTICGVYLLTERTLEWSRMLNDEGHLDLVLRGGDDLFRDAAMMA